MCFVKVNIIIEEECCLRLNGKLGWNRRLLYIYGILQKVEMGYLLKEEV